MASSNYYMSQLQMTGTSLFSTCASFTGMLMLVRSMFNDLIPGEVRSYIVSLFHYYFHKPPPDQLTIIVDHRSGYTTNHVYEAAETYLRTIIDPSIRRLNVTKTQRQNKLSVSIEKGQQMMDSYQGIDIIWRYALEERDKDSGSRERNCFEIIFDKKFKDTILDSYLPYIMDRFKQMKNEDKIVRMYTRGLSNRDREDRDDDENGSYSCWGSVRLEHPLTFEKLAMDPEQKKLITDDLDRFISRKEFYQRVGKAWKRGYLLYGPPGTGKSSLIAAMANYLKFDIYDLELSSIYSDSELRSILTSTTNRSILIIEDIDCSIDVQNRERSYDAFNSGSKMTLSGLLNFIDGLWSSCGDERIIVFTTNQKDKLDPALLRPGRMDVHIHMSYCTPAGFKLLVHNYLGVQDTHPLVEEIESGMIEAKVTPAEVAEELMRSEDPEIALGGVLSLIKRKAEEHLETDEKGGDMQEMSDVAEQKKCEKVASRAKTKKRPSRGKKRRC